MRAAVPHLLLHLEYGEVDVSEPTPFLGDPERDVAFPDPGQVVVVDVAVLAPFLDLVHALPFLAEAWPGVLEAPGEAWPAHLEEARVCAIDPLTVFLDALEKPFVQDDVPKSFLVLPNRPVERAVWPHVVDGHAAELLDPSAGAEEQADRQSLALR